jgi:hypothetical protein
VNILQTYVEEPVELSLAILENFKIKVTLP